MKRILIAILISIFPCHFIACKKATFTWENKEFEASINDYCEYLDSVKRQSNFDYIYVEASNISDSTIFTIYLSGGASDFINDANRIVDFRGYKKYDIMLIGDFPNCIISLSKQINQNYISDLVKKRYPKDYYMYLRDNKSPAPLIYDYMTMYLTFKKGKLVNTKRQYY